MICNSNDLLKLIVSMINTDNEVCVPDLIDKSELDELSLDSLLFELQEKHFVVYSNTHVSVLSLGFNHLHTVEKEEKLCKKESVISAIHEVISVIAKLIKGIFFVGVIHLFLN